MTGWSQQNHAVYIIQKLCYKSYKNDRVVLGTIDLINNHNSILGMYTANEYKP